MFNPLDLNGDPPELQGRTLQELLVQSFYCDGQISEEANVVYLKADGVWHRLYFDDGIVFWRPQTDRPDAISFTTDDGTHMDYRIIDLGRVRDLVGKEIAQYSMESLATGSRVQFRMKNESCFGFECTYEKSIIMPAS